MKISLLCKEYIGEDIADISRDVQEAFHSGITPNIDKCTTDENNTHTGKFRVSIIWCSEDDCDCTGFQHRNNCQNHWSNQPNPKDNIPY